MALAIGSHLGPYEIVSALGAGGMGEVYRARDTKLGRDVALKILPALFAADPDRLARFHREAQVLASLNHPNIAHIHGLEDSSGIPALVIELVEGPTLADRIAQGPIPVDEGLLIARQLAEALEVAHQQGIIHRDLKPANIKVRPDGVVKALDFGLAKIGGREVVGEALSQLATETVSGTRYGVILGTTAYMSPEQARGLPLDHRTDIWAFGCVLYELLSGRSAFGGHTISDTIAKILEREPDWRALPRSTPRTVRELIRRCVQKELQYRLRSLAVARDQIDDVASHLDRWRAFGPLRVFASAALVLTIVTAIWLESWKNARVTQHAGGPTQQHQATSTQHEPVAILIADFQNTTQDPAFDRTLEPMIRRALEDASFIHAYDRSRIPLFGVRPPEQLDESAARELATKQSLAVILSGSIARRGNDYEVFVRAADAVTHKVLASVEGRTSHKDQVVGTATKLVTTVRKALGDATPESEQLFALRSVSATSLEWVRYYVTAVLAQNDRKLEEARQSYLKMVELDPTSGLGYQGVALISQTLGKLEEADQYMAEALKHLEGLTDRERFSVRAISYVNGRDYQRCAKEYGELTARYPADAGGHNNRAACLSKLRNMREAVDEMRQAVRLLPKRFMFRSNLAVLLDYAGDFKSAEIEARAGESTARAMERSTDYFRLTLAFAQLGQGNVHDATATYESLATRSPQGASWSASGLGDLAIYEGRFSEAARILEQGSAADLAARNADRAARKLALVGYAQVSRGQNSLAIAAAEKALAHGKTGVTRFLAARIFVQAGALAKARTEAARISLGTFVSPSLSAAAGGTAAEPEAYAKIIEAEIALKNEDPRQAIRLLTEANALADTWLGHFDLGVAYLKVPAFVQADAEFDHCLKRRGEAISLFFDEEPTYGFLPPVYFYQGVAREGQNRAEAKESYRSYIAVRTKSTEDPLLREARQHARQ